MMTSPLPVGSAPRLLITVTFHSLTHRTDRAEATSPWRSDSLSLSSFISSSFIPLPLPLPLLLPLLPTILSHPPSSFSPLIADQLSSRTEWSKTPHIIFFSSWRCEIQFAATLASWRSTFPPTWWKLTFYLSSGCFHTIHLVYCFPRSKTGSETLSVSQEPINWPLTAPPLKSHSQSPATS